jgi:hypothetical protein
MWEAMVQKAVAQGKEKEDTDEVRARKRGRKE